MQWCFLFFFVYENEFLPYQEFHMYPCCLCSGGGADVCLCVYLLLVVLALRVFVCALCVFWWACVESTRSVGCDVTGCVVSMASCDPGISFTQDGILALSNSFIAAYVESRRYSCCCVFCRLTALQLW